MPDAEHEQLHVVGLLIQVSEAGMTAAERRTDERVPAYVAVEMSSPDNPGRCGVTRNASAHGLLIVTPSRFYPGEDLELKVHAGRHAAHACARVVRVDENPRASDEVFRYRLAVTLTNPLPCEFLARCASESC